MSENGKVTVRCANCGKEKEVFPSRVKYGEEGRFGYSNNKYCSLSCRSKFVNKSRKRKGGKFVK